MLVMTSRAAGAWRVVVIDGAVDFSTADQFKTGLAEAGAGSHWLIIDCALLTFHDSSFLRALLIAYRQARADGGTLLIAAAPTALSKLLTRTRLDKVLLTYPSVAAALA